MTLTDKFNLGLFEPDERVSLAAINQNTELLDAALQTHEDGLGVRAKMQTGSWVGNTPCADPKQYSIYSRPGSTTGNTHGDSSVSAGLGAPVSSDGDIVLTLNFEPQLVVVSGHMEADIDWSGYLRYVTLAADGNYYYQYDAFTLSGKEYLTYRQTIRPEQPICSAEIATRSPYCYNSNSYGDPYTVGWNRSGSDHSTLVECAATEDGKFTVTIKGVDTEYGTENYADIEGMTYHWVAFG